VAKVFGFGKKVGPTLGLDINSSTISLIQIEKTKTDTKVSRFSSMPTPPDIVREGLLADPEAVGAAVRELLDLVGLPAKKPLPNINLAIPGQAVVIRLMPVPTGMPPEELNDVVQQEAVNNLPFPLSEANLDYCLLPQTERTDPDGVRRVDVLLAAIQRVYVDSYWRMAEAADITIGRLDISPLAVIRALSASDLISDDGSLTMAVNIRNDATDITLIKKGMPLFSRSVLLGVETLGEAISRSIDAPIDEAISLLPKLQLGSIPTADPKLGQAAQVARSIFGDLTAEVGRSLEFYMSQVGIVQVDHIILSGAACVVPGLGEFISNRLNIETIVADPFKNLIYDKAQILDERRSSHAMLVGLVADTAGGPLSTVEVNLNKQGRSAATEDGDEDEEEGEEEVPTPWFAPALAVGSIAAVLAIGAYAAVAFYFTGVQETEIAQIEEQIATEKSQVDQMSKQQDEVIALKQKQEMLNKIVNHGTPRSVILQTMKNNVPEGVSLTRLELTDNKFLASGNSVNFTKASHYAINLQGTNLLDECKIVNVHRLKTSPQVVGFQLSAQIKPEAATMPLDSATSQAPAPIQPASATVPATSSNPNATGTR
jgi:type IV pilus assembly protein PilM